MLTIEQVKTAKIAIESLLKESTGKGVTDWFAVNNTMIDIDKALKEAK